VTSSQIVSGVVTAVTIIDLAAARLGAFTALLPPAWAKWIPAVIAAAGVLKVAFSQSLSPDHVSVPYDDAVKIVADMEAPPPALLAQVQKVAK
jgi:hypothetical protein